MLRSLFVALLVSIVMLSSFIKKSSSFRFGFRASRTFFPASPFCNGDVSRFLLKRQMAQVTHIGGALRPISYPHGYHSSTARFMSTPSGGGVPDNPQNPQTYTEKAWDSVAKLPQYGDKYSTTTVDVSLKKNHLLSSHALETHKL